ncbi:uncharacterized protein LOC143281903 [Babylonia areolata]|uniref:uncharacterized protein LOC143281903 n=1 Tax=Babylonia areolata TaxID=304850 RepID=UPI003FD121F8
MTRDRPDNISVRTLLAAANFTPGTTTTESRRQSTDMNPFTFQSPRFPQGLPTDLASRAVTVDTGGGQSLVSRRPRSQRLAPLLIATGRRLTHTLTTRGNSGAGQENVEEEGRELFSNFVSHQAQTENPEAAERLGISPPASYTNERLVRIGRELRHIARSLENSPLRQRVRHRAAQVQPGISQGEFRGLLRELFAGGGVTRERIVVLFIFCCDVAMGCSLLTGSGAELCARFMAWSLAFISENVCAWVRSHGGWGTVMGAGFSKLSLSLALAGVIIVGYGVIRYVTSS